MEVKTKRKTIKKGHSRRLRLSLEVSLVGEASASGFYIAITRGLAPILLVISGFNIRDILLLSLVSYISTYIFIKIIKFFENYVLTRLKKVLMLTHPSERIAWGLLPFIAFWDRSLVYPIYVSAITLGVINGLLINTIVYNVADEKAISKLITRRTAASATTNIVGQIVSVSVLAFFVGNYKYETLYVMAFSVGLIATFLITSTEFSMPTLRARRNKNIPSLSAEKVEAETIGLYLIALTAFMAILAPSWAPFIIKVKGAPEYLAASLGLFQMLGSVFSSLYWSRRSFSSFKKVLIPLIVIPLAIPFIPTDFEPILAFGYAFLGTGASLLASYILARLSSQLTPLDASAKISESTSLAQILGLGIAMIGSFLGYQTIFIISSGFASLATIIALVLIPEVSLVPRERALIYSRKLYMASSATIGFVEAMSRRAAVLTIKILSLILALFLVAFVFKVLQYLIMITP